MEPRARGKWSINLQVDFSSHLALMERTYCEEKGAKCVKYLNSLNEKYLKHLFRRQIKECINAVFFSSRLSVQKVRRCFGRCRRRGLSSFTFSSSSTFASSSTFSSSTSWAGRKCKWCCCAGYSKSSRKWLCKEFIRI